MIITNQDILSAIKVYYDKHSNPIKSKVLENLFNVSGIKIRKAVRGLRRSGIPVASNKFGYSIAENFDEIRETIIHLEKRAKDELITAGELKKCFNEQGDFFIN